MTTKTKSPNGKSKPAPLNVKDLTNTAKDRELWLNKMAARFVAHAIKATKAHNKANPDANLPTTFPAFRVGVGSTTKRIADYYDPKTGKWKGGLYGVSYHHSVSGDNRFEIVLSLFMGEMRDVLDTLAHELVHAMDRNEHGHEAGFQTLSTVLGLVAGPKDPRNPEAGTTWTNAICGDALIKTMMGWTKTKAIGKYPHSGFFGANTSLDIGTGSIIFGGGFSSMPVKPVGQPTQRNRYRKVTCPSKGCGYVVRATKTMLEMALPICGACHAKTGKVVTMTLSAEEAAALDSTKKPGRPKGSGKKGKAEAKPKGKAKAKPAKSKAKAKPAPKAKAKSKGTAFRNLRVGERFNADATPGIVWTKTPGGKATWTTPDGKVTEGTFKGTHIVRRLRKTTEAKAATKRVAAF